MRRKRKIQRQKSSFKSWLWKIGILVFILLVIGDGYILYTAGFFNIKNIDVQLTGVDCVSKDSVKRESGLLGKNILLINSIEVSKNLSQKYLCIKSVNVERNLSKGVVLKVNGRKPVANLINLTGFEASPSSDLSAEILATSSAQTATTSGFLVDSDGVIFGTGDTNPKIYLWGTDLAVNQTLKSGVISDTLGVLMKLGSFGVTVGSAQIYSQNILLVIPTSPPKLIFSFNRDINIQLASLQLILTEAKINNRGMEFIDLRYDKPVVKYAKKENK